jgi:enoyl-CoA hydratase
MQYRQGESMAVMLQIEHPDIAILKIDRPEVRNALDWEAIGEFTSAIEEAHAMAGLKALIVTGSDQAFIAGGDLKILHEATSEADGLHLSRLMTNTLNRLEALPCPVIAAINGPARGGGAEIAMACDLRVLDQQATLGFVQVNLGIIPGWGATQRLLRLAGYSLALEWLVTGKTLDAQELFRCGLVNYLTPQGEALSKALELAQTISQQPQESVRTIKRLLRFGIMLPSESAAAQEQIAFPGLWNSEAHWQAVEQFVKRKTSPS